MQIDSVSGELLLNNGTPPWWSFYTKPSDLAGCQGLNGPMAIVVSEETPRMYLFLASSFMSFLLTLAWPLKADRQDLLVHIV